MFKLDKICGSENSPNVWDLYLRKHDGLSFMFVWKSKNNHKISNKNANRFQARGCEGMTMELKGEGSGACCGAFWKFRVFKWSFNWLWFRWSIIQYLSMVFFPLKLGESYPYLKLSCGLLIDYGLGDALIFLHDVFAFEIGWIKPLFKIFRWSSYWFWFKLLFNACPWVFYLWIMVNQTPY